MAQVVSPIVTEMNEKLDILIQQTKPSNIFNGDAVVIDPTDSSKNQAHMIVDQLNLALLNMQQFCDALNESFKESGIEITGTYDPITNEPFLEVTYLAEPAEEEDEDEDLKIIEAIMARAKNIPEPKLRVFSIPKTDEIGKPVSVQDAIKMALNSISSSSVPSREECKCPACDLARYLGKIRG